MTGVASSQTSFDPVPVAVSVSVPVSHFPLSTSHFHFIFRFPISAPFYTLAKGCIKSFQGFS